MGQLPFASPKTKMISMSMLVISLPVLYAMHVPPSTLFTDTVFWFIISNTIIIIIATDSGVFSSSSSENYSVYDEYLKHRSYSKSSYSIPSINVPKERHKDDEHSQKPQEEIVHEMTVEQQLTIKNGELNLQTASQETSSEYVNMSDEELNRRVEEFIKKFKEIELHEEMVNE
ncbi:uncharacterized protein LOC120278011 [Dioscorea cayenensis subsp. rotundata]|uniref:Uncharacterized protein LOC120278011 n=1 Tax=Dioscorea cayennensis subsp. rotundata TaxID=55577 RepID=A0AB40CLW6_DIOCR|nr:uncharacterized protein LOC120278011 [Dioscorea cayenensis subsp. rotundata]